MRRWAPEEKAEIARRFAAGETVPALCVAYGTTWNMVRKFLALHGAKRLRADGRAYQRGLTEAEKAGIVARYRAGESTPDLAIAFACSHQTIGRTVRAAGLDVRTNAESHTHCTLNAGAFDVLTPEALYWIGFLFADGCVHHHKGGGAPALKVGLADKDAGHLYKLRDFLGSTHKVRHATVTAKTGGPRYGVADLYIRSVPLVASLERLGMCQKSLSRVALPEFLDSRDFWRGCVDGDGSASLRPAALLLCGGETLVGQFAHYLEHHGIATSGIYKHGTANCWYVRASGGDAIRRGLRLLYDGAAVALDRKVARVQGL